MLLTNRDMQLQEDLNDSRLFNLVNLTRFVVKKIRHYVLTINCK
jgi:hypothetical protein